MTLEDDFHQALEEWKEHCKRNINHSATNPHLDCDAFRNIVSIGPSVLPLIRDQIDREYKTLIKYDNQLKKIKLKVFGDDSVKLFNETYDRICEDEEYNQYEEDYYNNVMGNPGIYWCHALEKIIPDFKFPIGEKGSKSVVERDRGLLDSNIDKVQKATIEWLDENMYKYI